MNGIQKLLQKWFKTHKPLTAGVFSYHTAADAPNPYRLHLRVEGDGSGVLIVNAATVLHLNQTAAEFAYHLIAQTPAQEIAKLISMRYNISREQAEQDNLQFSERIHELIHTPDLDPVAFLDFERTLPYSRALSAPYRLDCALTYRYDGNSTSTHKNVERELTTNEWKTIIDKAWQSGIPHIIFTGGEPTLRDDLAELLTAAEQNGQVSGLITNGLRFTDRAYFERLAQTGLDHLMIVFDSQQGQSWEALRVILPDDLFTAVHLTITQENQTQIPQLVQRIAEMGANALSLSIDHLSLQPILEQVRGQAARLQLSLVWDLPVPYTNLNPLALEMSSEESVQGAGRAWLYVEPDGDVLPAQGMQPVLGNILQDEWQKIWKNATSTY